MDKLRGVYNMDPYLQKILQGIITLLLVVTPAGTQDSCDALDDLDNGFTKMGGRNVNDTITYICDHGYRLNGTAQRTCLPGGQWSGTAASCQEIQCPKLSPPMNGRVSDSTRKYKSKITVTCDKRFKYTRLKFEERTCLLNATWSGEMGECQAIECPTLDSPSNGLVNLTGRSYGDNATFRCNEGYMYNYSAPGLHCQENGTWSEQTGECEPITCPELSKVEEQSVIYTGRRYGDNASLNCDPGHEPEGSHQISCRSDGNWSGDIGKCKVKGKTGHSLHIILPIVSVVVVGLVVAACVYLIKKHGWLDWLTLCSKVKSSDDSLSEVTVVKTEREEYALHAPPTPIASLDEGDNNQEPPPSENEPLLTGDHSPMTARDTIFHCSFVLDKEYMDKYPISDDGNEYNKFVINIKQSIVNTFQKKLRACVNVVAHFLCKSSNMGFVTIKSDKPLKHSDIAEAVTDTVLASRDSLTDATQPIVKGKVQLLDEYQIVVMADVHCKRETCGNEARGSILAENRYVKRKLKCVATSDIGKAKEIHEEDLIKTNDIGKYMLIHGCCGIGKTTLVKQLVWKWANYDWCRKFKVLFLLDISYLMTLEASPTLTNLLGLYSTYNPGSTQVTVDAEWLKENQDSIGIIIDGIGRIPNFKKRWRDKSSLSDVTMKAEPLNWCMALMRRECLSVVTLIITSRLLTDLEVIEKTMSESERVKIVELMALTGEQMNEYVDRNVPEEKAEFVKNTLSKDAILSGSENPSYYAALCGVIGREDGSTINRSTYTQTLAEVLQTIMLHHSSTKTVGALPKLARQALFGLLNRIPQVHPEQVYQLKMLLKNEIDRDQENICVGHHCGFLQSLLQDLLAMTWLVMQRPEYIRCTIMEMLKHDCADPLLFLYGMAFNQQNQAIKVIYEAVSETSITVGTTQVLLESLSCLGKHNSFLAIRIGYESQSPEVVRKIGTELFQDWIQIMDNRMTFLNITALRYHLQNNAVVKSIVCHWARLDIVAIREFAILLKESSSLQQIQLSVEGSSDDILPTLMEAVRSNTSLQRVTLFIISKCRNETLDSVVEAVNTNKTVSVTLFLRWNVKDALKEKLSNDRIIIVTEGW